QQTREAGIRLALGARPGEVVRLVLARTLAPVWVGVAAGVALGLGAGYALSSMLAGLRMIDPPLVASIAATMAGIALLAAWVPARRVVSVDPATVLRFE